MKKVWTIDEINRIMRALEMIKPEWINVFDALRVALGIEVRQ